MYINLLPVRVFTVSINSASSALPLSVRLKKIECLSAVECYSFTVRMKFHQFTEWMDPKERHYAK